MGGLIMVFIFSILSLGWIMLWVLTYAPSTIGRFIRHTIIFTLLSLLIAWLTLQLIFAPVDETYSASNKGGLGILYMLWISVFVFDCLVAFCMTLKNLLDMKQEQKQNKHEEYD